MKHIKKSFLKQEKLTDGELQEGINSFPLTANFTVPKNAQVLLITDTGIKIQGFSYKDSTNKTYLIPEPDQVLIYFHCAQSNYSQLRNKKKELLDNLSVYSDVSEKIGGQVFDYFGLTSGCIIFMFSAIEAFLNQLIPDNFEYKKEGNNRTEIYNKEQIQRSIDFDTKLKTIIPIITGKDFMKAHGTKANYITNLKNFRDELIHAKHTVGHNRYDTLCKTALNFKYEEALHAVRDLLNFYKPDYITECSCGQDF